MRFGIFTAALLATSTFARADERADAERAVVEAEQSVRSLEVEHGPLDRAHRAEAETIARLKAEPPALARDLKLEELLRTAQQRSQRLDGLQVELRVRRAKIGALRRALIAACDRALAGSGLTPDGRAALVRQRAAETAKLVEADSVRPLQLAEPVVDALDGPGDLDEKADLLKDSEDKLRREAERLVHRVDGIEERRRLRERASALEEDFFAEGSSARRVLRIAPAPAGLAAPGESKVADGPSPAAAPPPGGVPSLGYSSDPGRGGEAGRPVFSLRGVVDPGLLDELGRAEASQDPERQVKALRQLEASLRKMAGDFGRRERELRKRATELRTKIR